MATRNDVYRIWNEVKELARDYEGHDFIRHDYWILTFNNRKRSFGVCDYTNREIQISKFLLPDMTEDNVRETLMHEIAHAYRPRCGHNSKWRAFYVGIGGNGNRLSPANEAQIQKLKSTARYAVINTKTNEIIKHYHRKPTRDFSNCYINNDRTTIGCLKVIIL